MNIVKLNEQLFSGFKESDPLLVVLTHMKAAVYLRFDCHLKKNHIRHTLHDCTFP